MNRLLNWLFEVIIRLWKVDDAIPWDLVDAVMLTTYSINGDGNLSAGTVASSNLATRLFGGYPVPVYFGVFTYSPNPEAELKLRLDLLYSVEIRGMGSVATTIEEARRFVDCLAMDELSPRAVVVMTGPAHSRTAKWVMKRSVKKKFPRCEVFVKSFSWQRETDALAPMKWNRSPWRWLGINIAREIVYHLISIFPGGFKFLSKINLRQPT